MREKVSVAMAAYNGEKFIKEQVQSILDNLTEGDELVVSDDGSADATKEILLSFKDDRIKIFDGPKKGVKTNFENAIKNCNNRYIFLCDQDDIWDSEKVEKVMKVFKENNCPVCVHNCELIKEDGGKLLDSYFEYRNSGAGFFKNIMKNSYMGCCMAFDALMLKDKILPIPENIEMHDQWIGVIGDKIGKKVCIEDKLIKYIRHEDNASECFNHYGFFKMLRNRINLIFNLVRVR